MNNIEFKRFVFLVGNYGSGKTEIAINLAIDGVRHGVSYLVDMDIINPYFKSSSKERLLLDCGVKVVKPDFANTTMDVPTLPAEIFVPFDLRPERAVFDIGGDSVGAAVLGLLRDRIVANLDECEFLYVINPYRPMQSTCDEIISILKEIEIKSRVKVTALVANPNLSFETRVEDVTAAEGIIDEVSEKLNLPVKFVAVHKKISDGYNGRNSLFPIDINMRPQWIDVK